MVPKTTTRKYDLISSGPILLSQVHDEQMTDRTCGADPPGEQKPAGEIIQGPWRRHDGLFRQQFRSKQSQLAQEERGEKGRKAEGRVRDGEIIIEEIGRASCRERV